MVVETFQSESTELQAEPIEFNLAEKVSADPNWLNKNFLTKHLQAFYPDRKITIKRIHAKTATAKGENYNSVIYRVNVQLIDEPKNGASPENQVIRKLSIIAKSPSVNELAYELLSNYNVYNKEMEFYAKIAPRIEAIRRTINENDQFVPKVYGTCADNDLLLLEDMAPNGYKIESVYKGLNVNQAKAVLKKTASFHAAGAILNEQQPNIYENFKYGLISRENETLNNLFLSHFDIVIELISTWPDFINYTKKFVAMRDKMVEKAKCAFDAKPQHFNTFIQGDLWINNILLKLNENTNDVENAVIIDWAYACWASSSIDLHYFLQSSLIESLRPDKIDELVAYYHQNLVEYLLRLKYTKRIPTLAEYREQFNDSAFFGFLAGCLCQPIMINTNLDDASYENLVLNTDSAMKFKRLIYTNPKVHENLRKLIPYFDQFGIFE